MVPWHYKSGQSPDNPEAVFETLKKYHDITNPGNPQTKLMKGITTVIMYHDITNPGNPQTNKKIFFKGEKKYHDITNPGNPQTLSRESFTSQFLVPWHYKSGQSPDRRSLQNSRIGRGTMTLQIRAIPRRLFGGVIASGLVPWHYKSGQSPDMESLGTW